MSPSRVQKQRTDGNPCRKIVWSVWCDNESLWLFYCQGRKPSLHGKCGNWNWRFFQLAQLNFCRSSINSHDADFFCKISHIVSSEQTCSQTLNPSRFRRFCYEYEISNHHAIRRPKSPKVQIWEFGNQRRLARVSLSPKYGHGKYLGKGRRRLNSDACLFSSAISRSGFRRLFSPDFQSWSNPGSRSFSSANLACACQALIFWAGWMWRDWVTKTAIMRCNYVGEEISRAGCNIRLIALISKIASPNERPLF